MSRNPAESTGRILWYQMAVADAGAGPAEMLKQALDDALASRLCHDVILSFTRPVYRAWEQALAASLISRVYAAGIPWYAEVWLWPEVVTPEMPYQPEIYHTALTTLAELRRNLPGCMGTVLDTEAYGGNHAIVLSADPERAATAVRTVLDTDGPLSAAPADLIYPTRGSQGLGAGYAMYEPLGKVRITEESYYASGDPPAPLVPPVPHEGRGYFVWPAHLGWFWTPEMLFKHAPWKWAPPVETVMLYGGGHPWLAAAALRNYAEADSAAKGGAPCD